MPRVPLLLALALSLSCGGAAERPAAPARPTATHPAPTGRASLAGVVRLEGSPPAASRLRMTSDPACASMSPGGVPSESIVVGDGGGLANVIVRVRRGLPDGIPPEGPPPVVLDQKGCVFTPHVLLARAGRPLTVRNSDPTLHNVRVSAKLNPSFNVGLPLQGQEVERTFDVEEIIAVKCDVHPWMVAHVAVLEHPYAAVSNGRGAWEIGGLPAGSYTVEAWHEKLGTEERQVELAEDARQTIDFTFAAER